MHPSFNTIPEFSSSTSSMAPIAVGDTIPDGNLSFVNEQFVFEIERMTDQFVFETVSIYSLIAGKRALIIGLPGAHMPDCRSCYRPEHTRFTYDSSLFQQTLYITVNDPYVSHIWADSYFPTDKPHVKFLADSKATYVKSLGLDLDLTSYGLGIRSRKFVIYLEDRKVVQLIKLPVFLGPHLRSLESRRLTPNVPRAPIAVDDIIPDGTLAFIKQNFKIKPVSMHSIVTGKKVIVLGVRGAFSPRCTHHLVTSFVQKADVFKSMKIQEILCISVNDAYVMAGWKRYFFKNNTYINFLADPTAAYVTSLGLVDDLSHTEYGIRSKRFTMLLENCRVKVLEVHREDLNVDDMLVAMRELN